MIDTRAPVEFAKGSFENALNLPLMTDEERHQVGIQYKVAGQNAAIELGRALVDPIRQAERVRRWVRFARQHPEGYLYCFRGGLRSRITQQWMAEAGVHYPYVQGGYKAMRRFLRTELERLGSELSLILISGRTGTGKTRLLQRIVRALDLEGMAHHRGSSFGSMIDTQPTPINFEHRVAVCLLKLANCHADSRIFLEAEGRLVGNLTVPDALWLNMQSAPVLILEASMERRIEIGISDYVIELLSQIQRKIPGEDGFDYFAERHRLSLWRIRRRLGLEYYDKALAILEEAFAAHRNDNDLEGYRHFIRLLLERYYDPMYDYQLSKRQGQVLVRGEEGTLVEWLTQRDVSVNQ